MLKNHISFESHKDKKHNYGIFVSLILAFFDYIEKLLKNSFILSLFTDADFIKSYVSNSVLLNRVSSITGLKYKMLGFKNKCANLTENSVLVNYFDRIANSFFNSNIKSIGLFFLFSGLIIVSSTFAQHIESIMSFNFSDTFIFGVVLCISSLFFFVQKNKNLATCIKESRILSYFLIDTFYVKHIDKNNSKSISSSSPYAVLLGLAFGVLSVSVSPTLSLFILFSIAYFYLVFTRPENGILIICMLLPLLPNNILMLFITITTASLIFKMIRGKRSMVINYSTCAIIIIGVIFLSCSAFSFDGEGAFDSCLPYIFSIILSFCVITTIRSSRLGDKCFKMLGVSAILSVVFSLVNLTVSILSNNSIKSYIKIIYSKGFSGTFENGEICAAFLIAMIPFFIVKHPESLKIFSFPFLVIILFSLILCNSYYAIIALLFAIIISMCLFGNHKLITLILTCGAGYAIYKILPLIVSRFFPNIILNSTVVRNHGHRSIEQLIRFFTDYGFSGVGLGSEAVTNSSLGAGLNASHFEFSYGVYTDMAMHLGIPLTVICFMMMSVFLSKNISYGMSKHKSQSAKSKCIAMFTSITAIGIYALFSDFLYDFRILALMFLIFGLSSAITESAETDFISNYGYDEYNMNLRGASNE